MRPITSVKKKQCKYLVLRGAYEPQQRSFPASSSAAAAALAAEVLPPELGAGGGGAGVRGRRRVRGGGERGKWGGTHI